MQRTSIFCPPYARYFAHFLPIVHPNNGSTYIELSFCYQNCCEKKWSSDQEKLLKCEAEGRELLFTLREFANFLRSLEQVIQTVKGQNIFL